MYKLSRFFFFFNNLVFVQRVIQGISGLATVFFVAKYFSLELQGWFYTFSSLAAFYSVFELGLSTILVQLSAHIFSQAKWIVGGNVLGKRSEEFKALLQSSFKFYTKLSIFYFLIITTFGFLIFPNTICSESCLLSWELPWIFLVFFTALNVLTLPFISLVEGSGRINEVYFLRIIQNIFGQSLLWATLFFGYKLWALTMLPMMSFIIALCWIINSKPQLLRLVVSKENYLYSWRVEVFPLQWRVGLSWLSGFLLMQIYTPILFYYQGAEVAGQMGLSLTLANMLGILAQSWIARRVPAMAQAVNQKNWQAFDQIFRRDFMVSVGFYLLGVLAFCFLYYLISDTKNSERILSFWPFLGLLVVVLINHINGALAAHLRSYKKEPLVWVSLAGTILTVPIAVISAAYYSVSGVVGSIFLVQLFLTLPLSFHLWVKYNRAWRQ